MRSTFSESDEILKSSRGSSGTFLKIEAAQQQTVRTGGRRVTEERDVIDGRVAYNTGETFKLFCFSPPLNLSQSI